MTPHAQKAASQATEPGLRDPEVGEGFQTLIEAHSGSEPTPGRITETRTRAFLVVVGLDLSLTSTGVAVSRLGAVRTHRVRSSGKATASWVDRSRRLRALVDQVCLLVPAGALVMVEGPSYGSVSQSVHDRAGLWWMVFTALEARGCALVPVSPSQRMKYAIGKGGGKDAGKDNVLAAAIRTYPEVEITGNDVADAVIMMAMGRRLLGEPLEASLPVARLDALAKLVLPEIGPVKP